MGILAGEDIVDTDFINESEADATPANDEGRVPKLESDGKLSGFFLRNPIIRTYTASSITSYGSSTTRFDITNPSGTTFRYTWDGTGTDPTINATTFPIGAIINIITGTFAYNSSGKNNNGCFIVTGSGTNYFEITNTIGVAENDKTLSTFGVIQKLSAQTWTKPTGLKYIEVEVLGGGGNGSYSSTGFTSGGGAGGWSYKKYNSSELSSIENLYVANKRNVVDTGGANSGNMSFMSKFKDIIAMGGFDGNGRRTTDGYNNGGLYGGIGGVSSGGDINIQGNAGMPTGVGTGANSKYGSGGYPILSQQKDAMGYGSGGSSGESNVGGFGAEGLIIIKEYY